MTYQLPGPHNTHVMTPTDLVIGFSRDPDKFPLSSYVQIRPVKMQTDLYRQQTTEEAGRVLDGDKHLWQRGADRPMEQGGGKERFRWLSYRTTRRNFGFPVDYDESGQADWNVMESYKATNSQKAMTDRTKRVHDLLASDANWDSGHVSSVADIADVEGTWAASTVDRQDIKKSLNGAYDIIRKATLTAVSQDMLRLVMNPVTAAKVGTSLEIVNHIKSSPEAYSQVTGQTGKWSRYGLPNRLYGYEVVVEDTVAVTSKRGATTETRVDVMGDGVAYLLSRQGALVGPPGSKSASFSTVTLFMVEEMNFEEFDKPEHRRVDCNIVEDYDAVITATASCFKFKDCI